MQYLSAISEALTGPAIITRYLGPTDHRPSRVVASHKRDSDRVIRATLAWEHGRDAEQNHRAAALACLARAGFSQHMILAARGHDEDCYVWVAVGAWQVEPAALARLACEELTAAMAGGGDADSLALPLALARMAIGTDSVRPVVTGWALPPAPAAPAVILTDCLGRPLLTLPGNLSPAGALAAARAAGWLMSAPMAATADRLQGDPDPAAVAVALAARGGCPAAVAALKGEGVAS